MKKSALIWIWIIIIVVVLVIIGIVIHHMNNSSQNNPTAPVTIQTSTSPATNPSTGISSTIAVSSSSSSTATSSQESAYIRVVVLNTSANATLGAYLVAANSMTLYTYGKDTTAESNCTGQCALTWPPYTISTSTPIGGDGVTGTISTITRPNGTMQIIYNGAPLYFYKGDMKPGDTKGQNINGFSVAKP